LIVTAAMTDPVTIESTENQVRLIELDSEPVVEILEVGVVGPQGPQGPPGASLISLAQLQDVDVTDRADGSFLYYDPIREMFIADSIETKITLTDGGNF